MANFLELLDQEISTQERILEGNPAYIKLQALRATRALYVGSVDSKVVTAPAMNAPLTSPISRKRTAPLGGKSLEAVQAAVEILEAHGRPLRTAELLSLIADRGIVFSGEAPQNVISSLLSRSGAVVSRGGRIGWALKAWESEEGGISAEGTPSSDFFATSTPVEPGEEVAHDNMSQNNRG